MYEVVVLFLIALVWIIFASVQDLRTREVYNWLSFSLAIFALGFRFFYSLFSDSGFSFFYQGLIGFGIFFIVGNLLYYSRMFAGGDAKLMISLGSILPFSYNLFTNLKIFILFIFLFFLSGAVYGWAVTLLLSFKNFEKFKKGFSERLKQYKKFIIMIMILGIVIMALGIFESLLLGIGILIFLFPYFYIYAKTVDSVCMIKKVKTSKISEGEWLYEPIKIGGRIIKPSWAGLSKEDITLIRKRYKEIKIKQGIAFVPAFLISFLVLGYLWLSGNWNLPF